MLIQKPRFPVKDILLFGFLPGFLKNFVYRLKGYKIGKKVSIGLGSVICGDKVSVGDHTSIGFLTIVRGKEITIGSHVNIGSLTFLDTPFMEIGAGSKINEQVFVGGLQFPDSKFVLGRNCQIMQMTFINPARSIIVGDDSGIGGHCLIFGHTSWLSHFEGYAVDFEPIEIGNSVSVAWGAFLLPGTKIGDGAVIGANSMVSRTIPPRCLAIGYPARVVSKFPDFPKEVSEDEKVEMFQKIVTEMNAFFRGSGLASESKGNIYEVTQSVKQVSMKKARIWRYIVAEEALSNEHLSLEKNKFDVFLSLQAIPEKLRDELNIQKVMWIDIENKEQSDYSNDLGDEIVLFLRRYGVRFFREKE